MLHVIIDVELACLKSSVHNRTFLSFNFLLAKVVKFIKNIYNSFRVFLRFLFCEICEEIGLTLALYVLKLQQILNTAKLHVYILLIVMKGRFPYFPHKRRLLCST